MERENLFLQVFADGLGHQVFDGGLGEHVIGEGGQLVHCEVLLGYQLGSRDGWHPGEELVTSTVAPAVRLRLQVPDAGEELRGALVPKGGLPVELLGPLVIGEISLLHYQLLDGLIQVFLRQEVLWDGAINLIGKITHPARILVIGGDHLVEDEKDLCCQNQSLGSSS